MLSTINMLIMLKYIFTPGHTDGSASYVVNGKYLFTGDNMNLKNNEAILYNSVFNMYNNEQKQSIQKLSEIKNIEFIFTMHTGYSYDFNKTFSNWNK